MYKNNKYEIKLCIMLLVHILIFKPFTSKAQGRAHNWLIGYDVGLFDTNVTSTKARLLFDSTSSSIVPESRKMPFRAAQGNISDENGNLIIVSNGCWVANALGDTMLNGSGLNTGNLSSWCDNTTGLPYAHSNVVLPFPGDTNKYILFHQQRYELFYSLIDITLDGGLGGVVLKNILVLQDTFSIGFSACKHANGRDWWVVTLKDYSNLFHKILVSPDTIATVVTQNVNFPNINDNSCQPTFSNDGSKFVYSTGYGGPNGWHDIRVLNFDRCTGDFDSLTYIYDSTGMGFGLAFSSNSQLLYHSSFQKIYQLDLFSFIQDTVAINDGFYSPYFPFQTDFWLMYLAANGKIYISSGNGVIDMHVINSPDIAGVGCDVLQHSLHTPCFFVRSNVLHPNYYLSAADGTVCDSLGINNINELSQLKESFKIAPNPNNGNFSIIYLLPNGKEGKIEIYDINGRRVFSQILPSWSTLQQINLSSNITSGIYNCVLTSGNERINKKFVLVKE